MKVTMKHRRASVGSRAAFLGLLTSTAGVIPIASAVTYNAATVTIIASPSPSTNCLYFQLVGVSEADPIAPNNPWFGVPATQNGFNQIVAMLISIKLSAGTVQVTTTGALAGGSCGNYAGVDSVAMM
jgi:hypothetical protein